MYNYNIEDYTKRDIIIPSKMAPILLRGNIIDRNKIKLTDYANNIIMFGDVSFGIARRIIGYTTIDILIDGDRITVKNGDIDSIDKLFRIEKDDNDTSEFVIETVEFEPINEIPQNEEVVEESPIETEEVVVEDTEITNDKEPIVEDTDSQNQEVLDDTTEETPDTEDVCEECASIEEDVEEDATEEESTPIIESSNIQQKPQQQRIYPNKKHRHRH